MKVGDKGWVMENQRVYTVTIKEISPRAQDGGAMLIEYEDKTNLIPTRWVFPEHFFTTRGEVEAKVLSRIAKLQETLAKFREEGANANG